MGSRVTFEDAAEACADVLFDLENPSVQALADAFFAVLIINEWNAAFQGIAKQERLDGFNEECKRESSLLRIIRCQDCFAAIVEAGYAATIDDINALNDLNQ